jgi:membrane protein DedA with SNARE-associated domain
VRELDAITAICYTATVLSLEQQLLQFIQSVYSIMQWPGVVALMAIESACIPIPSEIIMPLAGWMLVKEHGLTAIYSLAAGAYGALGCTVGSVVAYVVGIKGGRPFLERYGRYILISRHDLDRADRWFERNGDWAIFVTRLLPVVRTFISLPAGIARMHLVKFLVYTFTGSLIWCTALAYGGFLLGEHWEELRAVMRPFDPLIVAIIIALIGYYIYRHIRRVRSHSSGKS